MDARNSYPKISIVTPSFNQGLFLEATIISVLGQNYPCLEYIIMDGGSTDNSLEIIKRYSDRLFYWVSEKDGGQSDAINKGFKIASGQILMWLNSDDLLMPGAFEIILKKIDLNATNIYFGNCIHFKNKNGIDCYGSDVVKYHHDYSLENLDYIIQPSSFWTKSTWEQVGVLNQEMIYAFDWEWYLRAKEKNVLFIPFIECLSLYRIHENHKSGTGGSIRNNELAVVYKKFSPSNEVLFKHLIEDRHIFDDGLPKMLRKITRKFSNSFSEIKLLQLLMPKKYKRYSEETIKQVKLMIL